MGILEPRPTNTRPGPSRKLLNGDNPVSAASRLLRGASSAYPSTLFLDEIFDV